MKTVAKALLAWWLVEFLIGVTEGLTRPKL